MDHQACDTYFVEDDAQAAHGRIRADSLRTMGRIKAAAMANELSRQACDSYLEDIVGHMNEMEVGTTPCRRALKPC